MKNRIALIGLLAGLLMTASGCALLVVGGAAAGGYVFVNGRIKATHDAPLAKCYSATLAVLKDQKYPIVDQTRDGIHGEILARDLSDTKVRINLEKVTESATEIHIRIGMFGDEAASRALMDKIKAAL